MGDRIAVWRVSADARILTYMISPHWLSCKELVDGLSLWSKWDMAGARPVDTLTVLRVSVLKSAIVTKCERGIQLVVC